MSEEKSYWMLCPKCKGVLGRGEDGKVELVCKKCKRTWMIQIKEDELRFVWVNPELQSEQKGA